MDQLNSIQCLQLANQLTSLLKEIGDYRHANYDDLSDDQNASFQQAMKSLADAAGVLYGYTPIIALEEADASINDLKDATEELEDAVKTIEKVQQWIDIASAAFLLATALLAHNPQNIKDGISGVVSGIEHVKNS